MQESPLLPDFSIPRSTFIHSPESIMPMAERLAERDILLLGENGHGVAEFGALKVELARILHRSFGFEVIAFEGGMGECYGAWEMIDAIGPRGAMDLSLYPMWETVDVERLFTYIGETKGSAAPLRLIGIDPRPVIVRNTFLQDIVARVDPRCGERLGVIEGTIKRLARRGVVTGDEARKEFEGCREEARAVYIDARRVIEDEQGRDAYKVCARVLDGRIAILDALLDEAAYFEFREKWMAEHLTWIARELHPGRKIIVWAHNYHIRRKQSAVDGDASMGERLPEDIRRRSRTVGFYMRRGRAVWNNRAEYDIPEAPAGTMEGRLTRGGDDIALFDLRSCGEREGGWLASPCEVMSWGVNAEKIVPAEQYDAIIMVDEVAPPVYVG